MPARTLLLAAGPASACAAALLQLGACATANLPVPLVDCTPMSRAQQLERLQLEVERMRSTRAPSRVADVGNARLQGLPDPATATLEIRVTATGLAIVEVVPASVQAQK